MKSSAKIAITKKILVKTCAKRKWNKMERRTFATRVYQTINGTVHCRKNALIQWRWIRDAKSEMPVNCIETKEDILKCKDKADKAHTRKFQVFWTAYSSFDAVAKVIKTKKKKRRDKKPTKNGYRIEYRQEKTKWKSSQYKEVGNYVKLKWDFIYVRRFWAHSQNQIVNVLFSEQTSWRCILQWNWESNVLWNQVHVDLLSNLFNLWTNIIEMVFAHFPFFV